MADAAADPAATNRDEANQLTERAGRVLALVSAAPELVACGLAAFSLPLMIALLVGNVVWPVLIPVSALLALVAMGLCGASAEPVDRRTVRFTLIAAAIVLAWFVANSFFTAEDLYAHRDPTTYNLAGRWLMDHNSLPIHTHPEIFGPPPGYTDESAGFRDTAHGAVYAQGNHLLPVLLAVGGRLSGTAAMLRTNVLLGALALFVFFGLARRIVGPAFGLLAMSALAVSIPMIYVSRDTFSEPLALMFLMGGLLLLYRAISFDRLRDYALAGFVAGTAALARIDTDASLFALIAVATVLLGRAPAGRCAHVARRVGAMLLAGLVPATLGWADVAHLSSGYYHDERKHILSLVFAAAALAVVGGALAVAAWQPRVRSVLLSSRLHDGLARWLSIAIVVVFAFLASRPLWMAQRGIYTPLLIAVQRSAGVATDGYRTYNEQTVSWQALYFGWPTVLLAVAGYVLLLRRFLRLREYVLLGVLLMGLTVTGFYLWSAEITPDQPWASRRYIPVVFPILLIAAAYTLRELRPRFGRWGRYVSIVGSVVMVGFPLAVTIPVITVREEVPQLKQVEAICRAVGPDGAVLMVDANAQYSYSQAIRSYCNVPAISLLRATPAQLMQINESVSQHGKTLYVMAVDNTRIQYVDGAKPPPYSVVRTTRWRSSLNETPTSPTHEIVPVYLGTVDADGLVVPVTR